MGTLDKNHPGMITGWQRVGATAAVVSLDTGPSSSSVRIRSIRIWTKSDNSTNVNIGSSAIVASSQTKGFTANQEFVYEAGRDIAPIRLSSFFITGDGSSDGVDFYAIRA